MGDGACLTLCACSAVSPEASRLALSKLAERSVCFKRPEPCYNLLNPMQEVPDLPDLRVRLDLQNGQGGKQHQAGGTRCALCSRGATQQGTTRRGRERKTVCLVATLLQPARWPPGLCMALLRCCCSRLAHLRPASPCFAPCRRAQHCGLRLSPRHKEALFHRQRARQ